MYVYLHMYTHTHTYTYISLHIAQSGVGRKIVYRYTTVKSWIYQNLWSSLELMIDKIKPTVENGFCIVKQTFGFINLQNRKIETHAIFLFKAHTIFS